MMNTTHATTATRTPATVSVSPALFDGSREYWTAYERPDTMRVEMSVLTPGSQAKGTFSLATLPLVDNPNCEPSALVELSLAEARILRDLLNRPEVQALLDAPTE